VGASPTRRTLQPEATGAVTFKWKDYRNKGRDRLRTMTLATKGTRTVSMVGALDGTIIVRHVDETAPDPPEAKRADA
jgi:hypothetical protein